MQGRDQDNSDTLLTDNVAEIILSDFDEAALDEQEQSTPTLLDAAQLAHRRRRAQDLLERRRLREELGDDDFNFDWADLATNPPLSQLPLAKRRHFAR